MTRRPFELELDGTRRQVALRREADRWIAAVDGRELEVSIAEAGGHWSMLVGPAEGLPPEGGSHDLITAGVASAFRRKSYEVAFEPAPNGELIVHVNGVAVAVTVLDHPAHSKQPRAKGGLGAGRGEAGRSGTALRTIVAPMPGRIVKVLVTPDEAVAAGQPLVVVEAMKMENELRAPRAGTVAEVRVAEGASVEANTVLVVLR